MSGEVDGAYVFLWILFCFLHWLYGHGRSSGGIGLWGLCISSYLISSGSLHIVRVVRGKGLWDGVLTAQNHSLLHPHSCGDRQSMIFKRTLAPQFCLMDESALIYVVSYIHNIYGPNKPPVPNWLHVVMSIC